MMASFRPNKSKAQRTLLFLFFQILLPLVLCPLYPVVLIAVVLPCFAYRLCNRVAAKLFRPDLDGITDVLSAFCFSNESRCSKDGFNGMSVSVVKGRLSVENMIKLVEAQVLPLEEYKALKAYPVRFGGYFHWKPDLEFKVKNHVRGYKNNCDEQSGGKSLSEEDLKRILGTLLGSPWNENQSMWELVLINNYFPLNDKGERGEKSVLVLRMHHFMTDGYSIVGLFKRLCTGDSTISVASTYRGRSRTRAIAELIAGPYFLCRFAKVLAKRACPFYITNGMPEDGSQYLMTWTEAISIKEVSEVRKKFGVSFQAVINALVGRAMYKLLKELGHEPPKYVLVSQPRFLPGHPGGLTNYVSFGIVSISLREQDPIRRVQCSQKDLLAATEAASPELLTSLSNMIFRIPYAVLKPPDDTRYSHFDWSVVGCPGPRGPVFIDGKQVEQFFLPVGTLTNLAESSINLCTSLGKLIFSFVARKHFVPDPRVLEMFNGFLVEEMEELRKAKSMETSITIKSMT